MKSKWLWVLSVGLVISLMVPGCAPFAKGPTVSIAVDKKVSTDGGGSWFDQVEVPCGSEVEFQVKVTNNGDLTLDNVMVYDDIPQGLDYVEGSAKEGPQSAPSGPDGTITWKFLNPLTPGASWYVYFSATAVSAGTWVNNVQVTGEAGGMTAAAGAVATVTVNESNCTCPGWGQVEVTWNDKNDGGKDVKINCGESVPELIEVAPKNTITLTATPLCNPNNIPQGSCAPVCDNWYVYKEGGLWGWGTGTASCTANFNPDYGYHAYQVTFTGHCAGSGGSGICPNCSVFMCVNNTSVTPTNCTCTDWSPVVVTWLDSVSCQPVSQPVECGGSTGMEVSSSSPTITVDSSMGCTPATEDCKPIYNWVVKEDGSASNYASGEGLPASFDARCDHQLHIYAVTLSAWCGNTQCPNCTVRLNVTCNYTQQWWAEYYNDPNPPQYGTPKYNSYAPVFPSAPVYSGAEDYENGINHDWGKNSPGPGVNADYFLARWTGYFCFDAGTYTFTATVDDGVRVWVDNGPIIGRWIPQTETTWTGTKSLTAGFHTVKVEYFERMGDAVCEVSWKK